jgi:serine/threonine protein kinase
MIEELSSDFELDKSKIIGKGSWSNVYLGKQKSLNRPVAIKIMKKELMADETFIKFFHREAEALAKITDEHIVQVYYAGKHADEYFFAMEYVQGLTLAKLMGTGKKFTTDETIHVAESVAGALKTAWESPFKIIHRDIKPSNIMVAYPHDKKQGGEINLLEAKIKVMDFGLAHISRGQGESITDDKIIGTPRYISPEQGMGNKSDVRADIYSLGIIIYEMAAGKLPFESETPMGFIEHHIHKEPVTPLTFNKDIPPKLVNIILKCIRKPPEERYQTPSELLAALTALKSPVCVIETPATSSDEHSTIAIIRASDKFNGLLGKARAAIQLNDMDRAKELLIEASGEKHDSHELKKLIEEYHAGQTCKPKTDLVPVIRGLINNARLEIGAKDFEKARFILREAYFLDPCSEEIDKVRRELEQKQSGE